jgi:hypothetical protein
MLAIMAKHDPLSMLYVSGNDRVIDCDLSIFSITRKFSNYYLITSINALIMAQRSEYRNFNSWYTAYTAVNTLNFQYD